MEGHVQRGEAALLRGTVPPEQAAHGETPGLPLPVGAAWPTLYLSPDTALVTCPTLKLSFVAGRPQCYRKAIIKKGAVIVITTRYIAFLRGFRRPGNWCDDSWGGLPG